MPCTCFSLPSQAYMSALTSSIKVLEQQLDTVNGTSGSVATKLSQAFGDNARQRDSQTDVQVTQLYQVKLGGAAWS